MRVPDKYVKMGDVHVRKGRPNWPEAFRAVATHHPTGDVGVLFCGNPAIAADLETNCFEASRGRKGGKCEASTSPSRRCGLLTFAWALPQANSLCIWRTSNLAFVQSCIFLLCLFYTSTSYDLYIQIQEK
jgi:hypothetical protein